MIEVDFQGDDCRPAIWRQTYQYGTVPTKMPRPLVTAGVEQWDNLPGFGIDSGDVRPLVAVARETRKAKVTCLGSTLVMLGNDVVDLEGQVQIVLR